MPRALRGGGEKSLEPGDVVDKSINSLVLVIRENFETFVEFRQRLLHCTDVP